MWTYKLSSPPRYHGPVVPLYVDCRFFVFYFTSHPSTSDGLTIMNCSVLIAIEYHPEISTIMSGMSRPITSRNELPNLQYISNDSIHHS